MEVGGGPSAPPTGPGSGAPEPETLEAGPGLQHRHRRVFPIAIVTVVLTVAALLVWQLWPRPVPPLTLDELEGVYAGMVRGDGTNDASVLQRPEDDAEPRTVSPAECQPLFDATAFERFPADAVDGVGTYWMADRVGSSLYSFRFVDAGTATKAFARVDAALRTCDGDQVRMPRGRIQTVQVARTPIDTTSAERDQLGYVYQPGSGSRFAVQVLRLENTLTWQFRYDTSGGDYSPLEAQRLMDSFAVQTRAVIDLRS